ncbi:MAG: DUF916 domain-containing protein [Bifidobacteriaceae bacterium]|jgi:hypothetical protein|nr:DUF916 domain-containing protein [Bifidobacteriaceae bacterium]
MPFRGTRLAAGAAAGALWFAVAPAPVAVSSSPDQPTAWAHDAVLVASGAAATGGLAPAQAAQTAAAAVPADDAAAPGGAVGWALAPADGDYGGHRPNYSYNMSAPGEVVDGIVLESRADTTLTLKVYAADGYTTADGLLDLRTAAETPEDAGGWIVFGAPDASGASGVLDESGESASPGESSAGGAAALDMAAVLVELPPGGSVTVPFAVRTPADATPGDHAAGIVTSLVEESGAAAVQVDRRLALRMYINVAGELTPRLTVGDLRIKAETSANPFASGRVKVSYTLTNTGNARVVPTEVVRVTGPAGIVYSAGEATVLPEVLPGSHLAREVTVLGVFALFTTTVEVEVNGLAVGVGAEGAAAAAQGTATVWMTPWLALAVLAVLAVGAVAIPLARARRRRSREAV